MWMRAYSRFTKNCYFKAVTCQPAALLAHKNKTVHLCQRTMQFQRILVFVNGK